MLKPNNFCSFFAFKIKDKQTNNLKYENTCAFSLKDLVVPDLYNVS